jgi:hypothetical protein
MPTHTCIRNLLRFWYVLRLVSMLVGVHGAARGVLGGFLLDLLLLTPAAKLTMLMMPLVLLLLLVLLPASAACDVDVDSPAAAAEGAAAAEVLAMLYDVLAKLPHAQAPNPFTNEKADRHSGPSPRSIAYFANDLLLQQLKLPGSVINLTQLCRTSIFLLQSDCEQDTLCSCGR